MTGFGRQPGGDKRVEGDNDTGGSREPRSAFLGGHGEESGGLLMDVLAATLGTLELSLFVFVKTEDEFKGLLAIFAVKLIARHGNLRKGQREWNRHSRCTPGERWCQGTRRGGNGGGGREMAN
jgi:hypothetical protein